MSTDGVGELRGSPTIVAPRKVAHNHDVAERLWNASVELTGVEHDFEARRGRDSRPNDVSDPPLPRR
ncbi:MAG: hypothetical protein M5R38_04235 [Candidatus Methylomirabilis sp.]|nr:hypothetical protein [Candidatus Methylomirabilis sp.]